MNEWMNLYIQDNKSAYEYDSSTSASSSPLRWKYIPTMTIVTPNDTAAILYIVVASILMLGMILKYIFIFLSLLFFNIEVLLLCYQNIIQLLLWLYYILYNSYPIYG